MTKKKRENDFEWLYFDQIYQILAEFFRDLIPNLNDPKQNRL